MYQKYKPLPIKFSKSLLYNNENNKVSGTTNDLQYVNLASNNFKRSHWTKRFHPLCYNSMISLDN